MFQDTLLYCAGRPAFRRAAHVAFRIPLVGPVLRGVMEQVAPDGERIWYQIPTGPAEGLWLKLLPKWEPGYIQGAAEGGMNEALSNYLKPGCCFYDVGAHIGFYSLIAARVVGVGGRVVSFEPDAENARVVQENASKNGFPQIAVVRAAVTDRPGTVQFRTSANDGPSRMSGMLVTGLQSSPPSSALVTCEAVSLDSLMDSQPAPDLVKIDVEGAELKVLEGARALLAQKKPALIIEVHDPHDYPAINRMLSGFGYSLRPTGDEMGPVRARHFIAEAAS